jgi:excisionase family DNA binding protein
MGTGGPERADTTAGSADAPVGRFYTVHEVANLLRVSLGTVYGDIRAGRLAAFRFGRKTYRITEEALQAYLAAAKVHAAARPRDTKRPAVRGRKPLVATTFKHLDAARLAKAWSRPSGQRP